MLNKLTFRAALAFSGLVAALLICEILCRLFLFQLLDIAKFKLVEGNFEYSNKADIIRPSSELGYEFIPNSIPEINSLGMLDRERNRKKKKGLFRVLFLGDSVTANGKIPALLEEMLNKGLPAEKYEIWNCAMGGYQVSQYARYLETRALSFNPDIILIGLCLNDFSCSMPVVYKTRRGAFYEYGNATPRLTRYFFSPTLFIASYLYRYVFFSLENAQMKAEIRRGRDLQFTEGSYWMKRIIDFTGRNHLPLRIVIYPYLMPLPQYSPEQRAQYDNMRSVLDGSGLGYADLVKELKGKDLYGLRKKDNPKDYFHPDDAGNIMFAAAIEKTFKR